MKFDLAPFRHAVQRFLKDDCPQMAAAISYYALFSIFPLLTTLTGLVGLLLQDGHLREQVVNEVLKNIPFDQGEGRNAVVDAVTGVSQGSTAIGILGLLGMAWSGSAVFGAVRRALNKVYGDMAWKRPFVQQKLIDLAMVLAVGLFFIASIAATAALRIVRTHSEELAGWGYLAERATVLWDIGSFLVPLALSFGAFLFLYALVPARRRGVQEIWPGALLAAVLFEVAKMSFSLYIEHFANYDVVYGSLGAVIALMFWVYVSSNIMLLGAELSVAFALPAEVEDEGGRSKTRTPLRTAAARFIRRLFVYDTAGSGTDAEKGRRPQ